MEFAQLSHRANEIRQKYDELNARHYNRAWTGQDIMAGFVGDVGKLSKIIMAKHGLRPMPNVDESLAHELSDCLWSILVLAERYDVDLVAEFNATMTMLEGKIAAEMTQSNQ